MISKLLPHGVLTYFREVDLCRVLAGADALPARELIVGEFFQLERHCKQEEHESAHLALAEFGASLSFCAAKTAAHHKQMCIYTRPA